MLALFTCVIQHKGEFAFAVKNKKVSLIGLLHNLTGNYRFILRFSLAAEIFIDHHLPVRSETPASSARFTASWLTAENPKIAITNIQ